MVGALVGGQAGAGIRAALVRRREARARSGADLRIRARAHPASAPEWRYWRGALVRRNGHVRWRPLLRRWRSFDLRDSGVVGARLERSAASGDCLTLELHPVRGVDHLVVSVEAARIVEAMLPTA